MSSPGGFVGGGVSHWDKYLDGSAGLRLKAAGEARSDCRVEEEDGCESKDVVCEASKRESLRQFEKAISVYDFDQILWLIDSGMVDVDQVCAGGENALTKACGCGRLDVIKVLVEHGCKLNHSNNAGRTGLIKAAGLGHAHIVDFLLTFVVEEDEEVEETRGLDIFLKDTSGKTALDWARLSRFEKCVRSLEAAITSEIHRRRRELAKQARLDLLEERVCGRNFSMKQQLQDMIRRDALEEIETFVMGCTMSRSAFDRDANEHKVLMEELEYEIPNDDYYEYYIDTCIDGGMTALIRAVAQNQPELCRILIYRGATIDLGKMAGGHSALTWACSCGHFDVVKVLLAKGAQIDFKTKKEGKTALMHATFNGHGAIAMFLVDHAVTYAMDQQAQFLRDMNIEQFDEEAIRSKKDWSGFLGEYINASDKYNRTARDYAQMMGHNDICMIFDEALERIQVRKLRIDKEKEVTRPVQCTNGCGFVDRADRISQHELWKCERRMLQCERGCGQMVKASEMEHHYVETCTFRIVRCKNIFRGCQMKAKQVDIAIHERNKCRFRQVPCRVGCGEKMFYKDLPEHESSECRLRVVRCERSEYPNGGCGEYMKWELLAHHLSHGCPFRLVKCRVGCGLRIRWNERVEHEENVCKQKCSRGCGIVLGPRDRRQLHENFLCERRLVSCRHNCGIEGLEAIDRDQHENHDCVRRPVSCPLSCGETIEFRDIDAHTLGEKGTCKHRLLPCLFDYVGHRIKMQKSRQDEETIGYVESFDRETQHYRVRVGKDVSEIHLGKDLFQVEAIDFPMWKCGLLKACEREKHIAVTCRKRKLACPNGCGQLLVADRVEEHATKGCRKRLVKCSNKGCNEEFLWASLWTHENQNCTFQKVKCCCGESLDKCDLENHALVSCQAAKVRCVLGCGTYVKRGDMDTHVSNECLKREVSCKYGCGIERMWAEEQDHHENQVCLLRETTCPQCDTGGITVQEIDRHMKELCPKRPIECACGERIPYQEYSSHKDSLCRKRLRWCGLGCRQQIPDDELQDHETLHCLRRVEICRLGCGKDVRLDIRDEHEAKECGKRSVECKYNCGDIVRAEALEDHMEICWDRVLTCGANSEACSRKMRSWLTGDCFHGCGRLVLCEAHNESALSWAAANGCVNIIETLMGQISSPPPPPAGKKARPLPAAEIARLVKERICKILGTESNTGQSPVTWAAHRGQVDVITRFADLGADLNVETSRGRTPLLEAIAGGHVEVVRFLLEKRVFVDMKNKIGLTPINLAKRLGNHGMAELLEDVNKFQKDQTKMFASITLSDTKTLRDLLSAGAPHEMNHLALLEKDMAQKQNDIAALKYEIKEWKEEVTAAEPLVRKRTVIRNKVNNRVKAIADKIDATVAKWSGLYEDEITPKLDGTKMALRFVRERDLRYVRDITDPTPYMNKIVSAACILLNIAPVTEKDPFNASATIDNYWQAARQTFFQDKTIKHQLTHALTNDSIPPARAALCEGLIEEIDWLMYENGESIDTLFDEVRVMLEYNADGDSDEEDEVQYVFIKALNLWIHTVQLYAKYYHGEIKPLKLKEGTLRVQHSQALLELEAATTSLRFAEGKLIEATDPLKDCEDKLESLSHELKVTKKRLYTVKLLCTRTLGGHTAISWAAMYGDERVVTLLLERGSSVDYEDEQRIIAAELIQLVFRHYTKLKWRPKWTPALSHKFQKEDISFFFKLRSFARQHRLIRGSTRPPLAQAVYNGHLECIKVLLHWGARMNRTSPVYPVGPTPYLFPSPFPVVNGRFKLGQPPIYRIENSSKKKKQLRKFALTDDLKPVETIMEVAHEGVARQGCKGYRYKLGWVDQGRSHEVLEFMEAEWAKTEEQRAYALEAARLNRARHDEYTKQQQRNLQLNKVILSENFVLAVDLIEDGGNVDHQTPEGHTALTYAALRGAQCINKDGEQVLAVELLLDRDDKIPNVNRETKMMHTALSMASAAGNGNVMQALIDRGADVNQVLRDGKTALIHGAKVGKWDSCRLLVERGADVGHRDDTGRNAVDWARKYNYVGVMRKLSEAWYGNLGKAIAERGQAIPIVLCGWGCGARLLAYPRDHFSKTKSRQAMEEEEDEEYVGFHERARCPKRIVECPHGCGIKNMWFEELAEHQATGCPNRPVECPMGCTGVVVMAANLQVHMNSQCMKRRVMCLRCGTRVILEKMELHDQSECPRRGHLCDNGCGTLVPWDKYSDHRRLHCPERNVRCRLPGCQFETKAKIRASHELIHCPYRTVACKWNCDKGCLFREKGAHEINECHKRQVNCPNRCKDYVEAQDLELHMSSYCPRRFVKCTAGCKVRVPFEDMKKHLANDCANREVECPNAGCCFSNAKLSEPERGKILQAKWLEDHVNAHCLFRKVPCGQGCGEKVQLAQLERHKIDECIKRQVMCRVGCPKMVAFDALENHEKYECRLRTVWCTLGCNQTVCAKYLNRHIKRECRMRVVFCSLGCGEEMREEDRALHEEQGCVRRGKFQAPSFL